jgi:hypothetical protein
MPARLIESRATRHFVKRVTSARVALLAPIAGANAAHFSSLTGYLLNVCDEE